MARTTTTGRCRVDGCTASAAPRSRICRKHRGRLYRNGDFELRAGQERENPAPCLICGEPVPVGLRAPLYCSNRCRCAARYQRIREARA